MADDALEPAAAALTGGEPCVVLIGGDATRRDGLEAAGRIAAATGARVLCETFPARLERGAGVPAVERLAYLGEMAAAQLDGARHIVLAGARRPVTFFAYPDLPGDLVPDGCQVHDLGADATGALTRLADAIAKEATPALQVAARPEILSGALTGRAPPPSSARCCPRARSCRTRRTRPGCGCPAPPPARRRTTGCR